MGRFLNIGIIQMPVTADTAENFRFLEEKVDNLMKSYHKPELILGVESIASFTPDTIPGRITGYFSSIAKKHGIYFIPGTISEKSDELPENIFYNTAVVFNPDGKLIAKYRKMAPWRPAEQFSAPGNQYCVFDIPEKDTHIGLQICYDLNFPEISRNETLMGAEVLIKLTMDPQELYLLNKHIHYTRALENQAYLVSTNGTGFFNAINLYGNSLVISPEGNVLCEAGQTPCAFTVTLDLDLVKRCRQKGTMFMDHYLKHLYEYNFPAPFASDLRSAPVFEDLNKAPVSPEEYDENISDIFENPIGKRAPKDVNTEQLERNLSEFLSSRKF